MSSGKLEEDDRKAQLPAAVAPGGVTATSSHPQSPDESEIERDGRARDAHSPDEPCRVHEKTPAEQEQSANADDLERLETVPSGPVYSIFSKRQKQFIVFMVGWAGFFSPLSANIYFPALNTLARELNVSSTLINLTLTSYMIFQGLAPTLVGDLADMAGRRPAYVIAFIVYIGANIGIALQDSYAALFVLRCLQSSGSSGTIALGNGVVADIATAAERGTYMGYAQSGAMIGPAIGPVLGGLLSQYLGWRAIFWFLLIMAVAFLIPFLIAFPETGRNVVGDGSIPPQGWNRSLLNYLDARRTAAAAHERDQLARSRRLRWPNPLHTLAVIAEKDVGLLLFYNSIVYTAFYTVAASTPYLFERIYGFDDLQIGLCYLPFGVGALLAPWLSGRLMDWHFRRTAARLGRPVDRRRDADLAGFPLERVRIAVALPLLLIGDAALVCYGWVVQVIDGTHLRTLAGPLVLQFVIGLALTGGFNVLSVILIDLYPRRPSTATAANNLVRCLVGAAGTALIVDMIEAMGRGWCFTFVAAVVLATTPILAVLVRWGPAWREARRVRMERKEKEKEEETGGGGGGGDGEDGSEGSGERGG